MAISAQTSRVKFMDDLEGHFCYLDFLMKSNAVGALHSVSEEQSKHNVCRERKIFVKAALQLLEAQEKNVVNSLIVPSLISPDSDFEIIRSGYLKKGTRVSKMIPNMGLSHSKSSYTWKSKYVELRHGEFSYYDDNVEETPLMSASLHSYHSQSHSKALQQPSAAQHSVSHGVAVNAPGTNNTSAATAGFKKSIPLSPDLCSCRVVQYASARGAAHHQPQQLSERDDAFGADESGLGSGYPATPSDSHFVPGHAFELCLLGGQRRLFLTASSEESREWVRDIMTAMLGGASAGNAKTTENSQPHTQAQEDRKMSFPAMEMSARNNLNNTANTSTVTSSTSARLRAQEGGAGPYAGAISEYLTLQQRLHSVREEDGYKAIMRELVERRARVAVPVAYIKGKCSDNSFISAATHLPVHHNHHHLPSGLSLNGLLSGKHKLHTGGKSSHKIAHPIAPLVAKGSVPAVCVERSQMWKDLQRDEVCVNGECVAGASANGFFPGDSNGGCGSVGGGAEVSQGAEAIVGLLVRHIADAVDKAKAELQSILLRAQPNTPLVPHHVLLQVMTEAQVVQCARSVLMMCNRTQSGGDTYYCVDTLLRRKLSPEAAAAAGVGIDNLFILAPMSNKAEPLTIEVDLVETDRAGFDPEGGGSRLQIQQKAAAFATPTAAGASNNGALFFDQSPRTDFIDALTTTTLPNAPSSPAVPRTLTTDTADTDPLKRRSSRRMHLKLSIDEDVDFYERERTSSFSLYADAATPLAAGKVLRSEFVSILEENSSHNSDTTDDRNNHPHRRAVHTNGDSNHTVSLSSGSRGSPFDSEEGPRAVLRPHELEGTLPLRVLSIDEAALHEDTGNDDLNGSNGHTPPYLISTRDDSTVISDITFDTTAAFSQHTTIASYHRQTRDVPLGCADENEPGEAPSPSRPGKKSGLKGGKSLIKMISSRLNNKHAHAFTPGGSYANNTSDQDLLAAEGRDALPTATAVKDELRPSYSSFGSLQALTPGRSRGGSHSSNAGENNNASNTGGGTMLSSLFKSERGKGKQGVAQDHGPVSDAKARKVLGLEPPQEEKVIERKACVCVRLRVRGVSRYRVCSADPQGEPAEDNWAAMEGAFSQTFFVPAAVEGDYPALSAEEEAAALAYGPLPASAMVVAGPVPAALSRLAMTDRVVVISALKCD